MYVIFLLMKFINLILNRIIEFLYILYLKKKIIKKNDF